MESTSTAAGSGASTTEDALAPEGEALPVKAGAPFEDAASSEPEEREEPALFPPGPLARVKIVPSRIRLAPSTERRFRARAEDEDGRLLREGVELRWSLVGPGSLVAMGPASSSPSGASLGPASSSLSGAALGSVSPSPPLEATLGPASSSPSPSLGSPQPLPARPGSLDSPEKRDFAFGSASFGTEVLYRAPDLEGDARIAVEATQGERSAIAEAAVQVRESSAAAERTIGIPEPQPVNAPSEDWRSRLIGSRWEYNEGHRDYLAVAGDESRRLRYLVHLFAKEVVLRNFGSPQEEPTLERMVEVLTHLGDGRARA